MRIKDFVDSISMEHSTFGSGPVTALSGVLGAALFSMCINRAVLRTDNLELTGSLERLGQKVRMLKELLLQTADEEKQVLKDLENALDMANKTKEEKVQRYHILAGVHKRTVSLSLGTAETCCGLLRLIPELQVEDDQHSSFNIGVAAVTIRGGFDGAILNTKRRVKNAEDEDFRRNAYQKIQLLNNKMNDFYSKINPLEKTGTPEELNSLKI